MPYCWQQRSDNQLFLLWVFPASHSDTSVARYRLDGGGCFVVNREVAETCEPDLALCWLLRVGAVLSHLHILDVSGRRSAFSKQGWITLVTSGDHFLQNNKQCRLVSRVEVWAFWSFAFARSWIFSHSVALFKKCAFFFPCSLLSFYPVFIVLF